MAKGEDIDHESQDLLQGIDVCGKHLLLKTFGAHLEVVVED